MLEIEDLSYCENLTDTDVITGSASAGVIAYAAAEGESAYTGTLAVTRSKELQNGMTLAWGKGSSLAIGDNPTAMVEVDGEGDIVRGKTKTLSKNNAELARGWVIAIDLPDK